MVWRIGQLVTGDRRTRGTAIGPSNRRVLRHHLELELLESRECLSSFYKFDIMAQTGANGIVTLQNIEPAVSINDSGGVALVGATSAGQSIWHTEEPLFIQRMSFESPSPSRTYGRELQLNNIGQVAAVDRASLPDGISWDARIWNVYNPGASENIVAHAFSPEMDGEYFDTLATSVSIANDGKLAFAGYEYWDERSGEHAGDTDWEIHLSENFVDARDTASNPTWGSGSEVSTLPAAPAFFRFKAADGNKVVVALRKGSEGPKEIVLHNSTGKGGTTAIASTAQGKWKNLGMRPGISDDGSIVTFYGEEYENKDVDGDGITGPGLFASVANSNEPRELVRIASLKDGFSEFAIDQYVSATNINTDTISSSFLFQAIDNQGKVGVFRSQVKFEVDRDTGTFIEDFVVSTPTSVILQGEEIPGVGTIKDVAVHDSLNNLGTAAFWVSTAGGQAIVRTELPMHRVVLYWGQVAPVKVELVVTDSGHPEYVVKPGGTPAYMSQPDYRRALRNHIEQQFVQSGISRVEIVDEPANAPNFERGATTVYFTLANSDLLGYAVGDSIDRFNRRPEDIVLVYAAGNVELDAETATHEIGHALGLRHINPDASAIDVMDYDSAKNDVELFSSVPVFIVEPPETGNPKAVIAADRHNNVYHLRRFLEGDSHDLLVAEGLEPGEWDLPSWTYSYLPVEFAFKLKDGTSPSNIQLYDVYIKAGYGIDDLQTLAHYDAISLEELAKLPVHLQEGQSLRLFAASKPHGTFDVDLASGDPFVEEGVVLYPEFGTKTWFLQMSDASTGNYSTLADVTVVVSANQLPVANNDEGLAYSGLAASFNVLVNDSDPDGDALQVTELESTRTQGTVSITPTGQIAYTPPKNFVGIDSVQYSIRDSRGAKATAELRITVQDRPRIIGISPDGNSAVTSLQSIDVDFSRAMDEDSVTDVSHYLVQHESLGVLPLTSANYTQQGGVYRVHLTLDNSITMRPGGVTLRANGLLIRDTHGQSLDGDNKNLFVINPNSNEVVKLGQTPGGVPIIESSQQIPGFDLPADMVTLDLNSDGLPDIVTVNSSGGEIVIYEAQSGGGYRDPVSKRVANNGVDQESLLEQLFVADWNVDGLLDLLVHERVMGLGSTVEVKVHILLNDGKFGLTDAVETPILLEAGEGTILAVADFTGDEQPDLAVVGPPVDGSIFNYSAKGSVSIYAKDRYLGYSQTKVLSTLKAEWYPYTAITGDFNGDGRPDLVVSNTGYYVFDQGIVAYMSTPTGLGAAMTIEYERTGSGSITAGDFTGDGKLDVAILHDYYRNSYGINDGNVVTVLAGDGKGGFTEQPQQLLNRRALSLAGMADFNGDGKQDLLLTASPWPFDYVGGFPGLEQTSTWVLNGDGQGQFHPATAEPISAGAGELGSLSTIVIDDLNADGWADVVLGSRDSFQVRPLLNDQSGKLGAVGKDILISPRLADHPENEFRSVVDINHDGLDDLLALVGSPAQLAVFLATSEGALKVEAFYPLPSGTVYGWLTTGDLNNDGNVDVVVATNDGPAVWLGTSSGELNPVNGSPFAFGDFAFFNTKEPGALADLNGDGNLDLLATVSELQGYYETPIGWVTFFGDGSGNLFFNRNTFLEFPEGYDFPIPASTPSHPNYAPLLLDYDHDGQLDYLVATTQDELTTLTVYSGKGNGTFKPTVSTVQPGYTHVYGYQAADFDGDGNLDVLGYSDLVVELFLGNGMGNFTLAEGYTNALYGSLTEPAGSSYRFAAISTADFNGDGIADVAASKSSHWISDINENMNNVTFFANDGTGRFAQGQQLTLGAAPGTLNSYPKYEWPSTANVDLVASLGAVKLTSPLTFPEGVQVLAGTGPVGAVIVCWERDAEIAQATVNSNGTWTMLLQRRLSAGYHPLQWMATNSEGLMSDVLSASVLVQRSNLNWHNFDWPLDVTDDGIVAPLDALIIINNLNQNGSRALVGQRPQSLGYIDTNNDGFVSPVDVLLVVNFLNSNESEGEVSAVHSIEAGSATPVPSIFSRSEWEEEDKDRLRYRWFTRFSKWTSRT
ncbi:FG-GAP repeat protein [Aureliella helgolandensis]|uniref:FG-GAP repeat protein n=2 Tax=Aureliella helgolandensis TaxID=2527968 RepID=A0A518G9K1_9BACT|nr:FG-GAP repeat protein [Aureliella helgolandensis]